MADWRRGVAGGVVLAAVLGACGGDAQAPPSEGPTTTATAAAESMTPGASAAETPVATTPMPAQQPEPEPLPEPGLDEPVAIGEALNATVTRTQGVVSLLAGLGIGIEELIEADPSVGIHLSQAQVHGLVRMAARESPQDGIRFRDWHAGLAELGLELGAAELVTAIEDAYYAEPEPPFLVEVLWANETDLHQTGRLTHLQAWLLTLDAFVVGADTPVAGMRLVSHSDDHRWGGASATVPRLVTDEMTAEELREALVHLEPMLQAVPFTLAPAALPVHEGHDGPGTPSTLALQFVPQVPWWAATPDGAPLFVPVGLADGLPVRWTASEPDVLATHGTMRDARGADPFASGAALRTDRSGRIEIAYTPREEEANGEGEVVREQVVVTASASLREVAEHVFSLPIPLLAMLHGDRFATANIEVEWHAPDGIRIEMTDEYDVEFGAIFGSTRRAGTDRFTGFLALQDDGTFRGVVKGETSSAYHFEALGESCETSLVGTQDLLGVAEVIPELPGGLNLAVRLYPIADPQMGPIRCEHMTPPRFEGPSPDDPTIPRGTGIPSRDYAFFNDQRVVQPDLRGVPARLPEFGSVTVDYTETEPGLGGGTWTVTVERVEAPR